MNLNIIVNIEIGTDIITDDINIFIFDYNLIEALSNE